MNAICNEPISNRDPRYAGAMAELEIAAVLTDEAAGRDTQTGAIKT